MRSSTRSGQGPHPLRWVADPERSSAARKPCETKGLNGSPGTPGSSPDATRGLAHSFQARASIFASDEAVRKTREEAVAAVEADVMA